MPPSHVRFEILEEVDLIDAALPWERARRGPPPRVPHLVLAWSLDEPDRLGEALPIPRPTAIGRGGPLADDPVPPENFIHADVDAARLGPDQPAPRAPDPVWPEAPGASLQ